MRILAIVTSFTWLAMGLVYFLSTGLALGFGLTGMLGLVILLFLALHLLLLCILIFKTYRYARHRLQFWTLNFKILVVAAIVSDILMVASATVGHQKVTETKARGDELFKAVEDFRQSQNHIPENLEELSKAGFAIPTPALRNSEFRYSKIDNETFAIRFNSVSWTTCSRTSNLGASWICLD